MVQERPRTNIDPDNSLYDRESDTNFILEADEEEADSDSYGREEEDDESEF